MTQFQDPAYINLYMSLQALKAAILALYEQYPDSAGIFSAIGSINEVIALFGNIKFELWQQPNNVKFCQFIFEFRRRFTFHNDNRP